MTGARGLVGTRWVSKDLPRREIRVVADSCSGSGPSRSVRVESILTGKAHWINVRGLDRRYLPVRRGSHC